MKTIIKVFVAAISLVLMFTQCEKEPGPNDPVEIPDDEFLRYLILDGVDTNGDGLISYGEAEKVTKIYLDPDSTGRRNGKVSCMEGIEAFINLDTLHCCSNQIKELDVSANTELRVLVCWNGDKNDQLEYLNVSNNSKLRVINIPGNKLTSLDISKATELERLYCTQNHLTSLDVSKNTKLTDLGCSRNRLTRLDASKNTSLQNLYCNENQLTTLYLTTYDIPFQFHTLDCSDNQLVKLDISSCRQLGYLGIRSMPTLHEVCYCYDPLPITFEVDSTGSPNVFITTECSH